MRLRTYIGYKLFTLLIAALIILLIFFNNFFKQSQTNEFLTVLTVGSENDEKPATRHLVAEQNSSQLLNLSNFQYLLSNDLCQRYDKELLAILIITSYAGHDELRSAHRQAIAQSKLSELGFQRVFLLAALPEREHFITQPQLISEQQRFGDILQGNFLEAYRNLSYKHVMGLRWAATRCGRAKFIVKIDDDIVYDAFQLRRYLESLELQQHSLATSSALLAGYILDGIDAIRNVANKWYVSPQEFPHKTYPAYLSGWLYITNPSTALRLVEEASRAPIFWIDDTWITGILRERLRVPLQRLNSWFSANAEFLDCCVRDLKQSNYECEYFVGPNGGDAKLLVEFIHNVEKCYFDECVKRAPEQSLKRTCVASFKQIIPAHGEALVRPVHLGR